MVTGLTGVVDDGVIANYSHAAGRWHGAAKSQAFSDQLSAVGSWMRAVNVRLVSMVSAESLW